MIFFFFSSRRRHTRCYRDWSSDVCSSDLPVTVTVRGAAGAGLTVELRNPAPAGEAASLIPGGGTGLIGLAERAAIAGGRLEHDRAGDVFQLRASLPWPP